MASAISGAGAIAQDDNPIPDTLVSTFIEITVLELTKQPGSS
jgi:hypothetical protein